MCNECATKHGLFNKEELPFAILSSLGEALFAGMKQSLSTQGLICSKCGCTPMSFKETGRLGCSNCYKDLKLLVDGIVESAQKGMFHKGKKPKSQTTVEVEKFLEMEKLNDAPAAESVVRKKRKSSSGSTAETLRKKLEDAIKAEKYEEAAKLRDEIRGLKGGKE
jgi:protein arginine kinase activator